MLTKARSCPYSFQTKNKKWKIKGSINLPAGRLKSKCWNTVEVVHQNILEFDNYTFLNFGDSE